MSAERDRFEELAVLAAEGYAEALLDGDVQLAGRFAAVGQTISLATPPPAERHIRRFAERLGDGDLGGAIRAAQLASALSPSVVDDEEDGWTS